MTVIGAFLSTWERARLAFGNDAPVDGAQFDIAAALLDQESDAETLMSGEQWSGPAADGYDGAAAEQRHAFGQFAALDRRLAAQIQHSAQVVAIGRQHLESVKQWVVDAAAHTPGDAAGERMKMAIVRSGYEQLAQILERSNAESNTIAENILRLGDNYRFLGNDRPNEMPTVVGVDFSTDIPDEPPPVVPGQPVDPANPFIGDLRFGHWEPVIAPPYTGTAPPPLTRRYRPFPEGTPLKTGGTTGWYTPSRSWAADPPYAQLQEQYRFRIVGVEETTSTRMVRQNGRWQQERWVQNVYEYQRNTQMHFSGDVSVRRTRGDIGGLTVAPYIDYEWKPLGPNEIAALSAKNPSTTYYVPDGCGGQFTYEAGVARGGMSGLPPAQPIMTRPR